MAADTQAIVGIDLGTTNSVIAIPGDYPDKGVKYGPVTVIFDEVERLIHASAVCMVDGQLVVGDDAKQLAAEGYTPVRFVKKYMGTRETFRVGPDVEWTAEQVSAEVLKHLVRFTEKALGVKIDRAVVTHPAYFDALAINATKNACRLAGLDVEGRLMMEPIAAAMAYTHDDERPNLRVLVYDLGGGTFDITLVDRTSGAFRPLAFGGDRELGGYNFDKKIATRMLQSLRDKGYVINIDANYPERDPRWASLMHHAEQIKIKLSSAAKADVRVPGVFKDDSTPPKAVQLAFSMTVKEFNELIDPEISKTIRQTHEVLQKAGRRADEVHRLVLVGGSSRIPSIRERLQAEFGLEPQYDEDVLDLSVAVGAAMIGAISGSAEGGVFLDHIPEAVDNVELAVSGRVQASDEIPDPSNFTVTIAGGATDEVVALTGPDGGFFAEVPLFPDQENELSLTITSPQGRTIYERTLSVRHDSAAEPPPPPPPPALPKPICVDSVTGLVEIAAENETLPLKKTKSFVTVRELTEVPIDIYQEDVQLGTLLLKGFSTPVPPNCQVDLVLEINTDYAMQFTANVPSTNVSSSQAIQLIPPPVPTVEELRHRFAELKTLYRSQLENTPDGPAKARIAAECDRLVEEAEELLNEDHPERMQADMLLRRLFLQVKQLAAGGGLKPPKAEVEAQFRKARKLLPDAIAKEPALAEQDYEATLKALETEAERAYQAGNAGDWSRFAAKIDEIVKTLEHIITPPGRAELPPPPITQMLLLQEIGQMQQQLQAKQQSGALPPQNAARCQTELQQAMSKVQKVDVSKGDAANMELIQIYQQHLKPVSDMLGTGGRAGGVIRAL